MLVYVYKSIFDLEKLEKFPAMKFDNAGASSLLAPCLHLLVLCYRSAS